jgi:hypothetical protein
VQSPRKEDEPIEHSAITSRDLGNDGFMGRRHQNLAPEDDAPGAKDLAANQKEAAELEAAMKKLTEEHNQYMDALMRKYEELRDTVVECHNDANLMRECTVYFVGASFAFIIPCVYHRLWPTGLGYQLVVYASIAYDLIKIFYSVHVQDWLNGLDAGTLRNRNPLIRCMHRMKADNTDFYGPSVGQNTKWSELLSLFYINSTIGHVVRSGWCVIRCGHDEVAMEKLRDFVCTHQFFHMGICRAQSMFYINRDAINRPRVAFLNTRRARHAQVFSLSIVACAMVITWLLDHDNMPSFNLVVKFFVDNCWYCVRFFIVDDAMFHIMGRCGQDSALVETGALMHLLESMFADFVMTVNVAFAPTMLDAWTQADFCVQVISMVFLAYFARPLQLQREGLDGRYLVDVFLKFAVIVSHGFTWLPS